MPLNRSQRARMAQETVQIIGHGHYVSPAGGNAARPLKLN